MMGFQKLLAFVLAASVLAIVSEEVTSSTIEVNKVSSEDLIQYHESIKPIKYSATTKQSELAPASKIVGIYFDTVSFNMNGEKLIGKSKNEGNKTKQSQDFETHSKPTTILPPMDEQQVTTAQQVIILHPATSSPSTITTTTTTTTTTEAPTTATSDPSLQEGQELPAGSRTVRQGSAVSCGEANPNGRSKEHLELDRIIGGKKTVPGEFPFQVRLNIRSRRGSGICGGVLLDDSHILTAAHCMTACASQYLTTVTIENEGVHAVLGDHAIRSNDGEVEVEIEKITPHEKYDACNFYANDHDIALIKTSRPIEYRFTSDGYGSINRPCMPVNNETVYKESDMVVVSGWGVTRDNSGSLSNILRYVQVPVVNVTRCQETYGSRVTNDHVCAGYQSGGKDSCQGDSGGPLVRVVDNRYELVGIVSFGYGCGQPGAPGVYTRVASYIDWIKANL